MRVSRSAAAVAAAALPFAAAQTSTSCNPLDTTCPKDVGLNAGSFKSDFTKSQHASWTTASGTTLDYGNNGATFAIAKAGQAPTIYTDFYFLFGRVDVTMQAAPGQGIISSIVLLSDDLDEIDWEFIGGNTTTVETNFFGKGDTTTYDRAIYYPVDDPQDKVHTYSIDWTAERVEWIIDGVTVRTLPYSSSLANGGKNYPQTPMQLRLGSWAAGGPGEPQGTVTWAGGQTNFNDGPFNMYVQSVTVTNNNPADAYEWEGHSGSWQSIKIVKGDNTNNPTGGPGMTSAIASVTNTKAPTSSLTGDNVSQTKVAVSTTLTGSSYSMGTNTASVSAIPSQSNTAVPTSGVPNPSSIAVSSMVTSAVTSAATTALSPSSTQSVIPVNPNGASANAALTAGLGLSVLVGAIML